MVDNPAGSNAIDVWLRVRLESLASGLNKAQKLIKEKASQWSRESEAVSRVAIPGVPGGFYAGATRVNRELDSIKSKLEPIKDKMGDMLSAANQMSLTAMRTILAGGAALIVAGFPLKEAAEFEKQMALVKGITQATDDQYKALTDSAIQMARETVFSATQAAEAMTTLAKAGFSVYEIMTVLPSVMHLAAAAGTSVAEAADVAANTLHGFGLAAESFSHVADVIAYSANFSNASITGMADSFKYVAPAARAAGMGIDETGAALAVLANAGIRGSMAGTTLRMMLLRLADVSGGFADKLDELGVRAYDTSGKMRNFVDIMEDLHRANVDIGQIGGVFTARSAAGAAALSKEFDMLQRFTLQNKSAAGEVKRLSDVVLNNFVGSLEYLKTSLSSLAIVLSTGLLTPLKVLVDVISWVVNLLARLADIPGLGFILQSLTGIIIALTGAMGGLLLVMGGAGIMVSGFIRTMIFLAGTTQYLKGTAIKGLVTELYTLEVAAGPAGVAMTRLGGAFKAAAQSIMAFTWATWAWIAAGVIVVGMLIAVIYQVMTLTKRSLELAEATSKSRKSFDEFYNQLKETAVGTGEHDRIIEEMIKKYPELAGQIRYTNQSWEEQQMILDNFRADLIVKELEAAAKALKNTGDEAIRLGKIIEAGFEAPDLAADVAVVTEADMQKIAKAVLDNSRRVQAQARLQWDTLLAQIDWEAIGEKPLRMEIDTAKDLERVLENSHDSVRKVRDQLEAANIPLEKAKTVWEKITEELKKQYQLGLLKKGGKPINWADFGMPDFDEAKRSIDNAVTYFNLNLGEKGLWKNAVDPESGQKATKVIEGTIEAMITAAHMFGPKATQIMVKDLKKLVDEFKSFKSDSDDILTDFITRVRQMARTWNDIIAGMKPLAINLKGLGGADWNTLGSQLNMQFHQIETLKNLINEEVMKSGGLLTQPLAMGKLMATGGTNQVGEASKRLIDSINSMLDPLSKFGQSATNCGDMVAKVTNTIADVTKVRLREGGLTPSDVDQLAKSLGTMTYRFLGGEKPTAEFMRKRFGLGTIMVTAEEGTHAQMVAPSPKTGEMGILSYAEGKPIWRTFEEAAKMMKTGYVATNMLASAATTLRDLTEGLKTYIGEEDQVRKAIAASIMGKGKVPVGVPYAQIAIPEDVKKQVDQTLAYMEQASKEKGPFVYDAQRAKEDQARLQETRSVLENLLQTGRLETPTARIQERAKLEAEFTKKIAEQEANLANVRKSSAGTANEQLQIQEAQLKVQDAIYAKNKALRDFDLQTAKELAKIVEQDVERKQKSYEIEVAMAEHLYDLHEAQASAEKARMEAMKESGVLSGAEQANKIIEMDTALYEEQLGLLDRKIVLARLSAEEEKKAIMARATSQNIELTNHQLRQNELNLEKNVLDILNQKKVVQEKNLEVMQNWAKEAAKARKELIDIGIDQLSAFAWGPVQNRAIQLLENAKKYSDLARKINEMPVPSITKEGGLIEPVKADPHFVSTVKDLSDAATALGTPWAQPLRDIVQELMGVMTPERFAEIREKLISMVPDIEKDAAFRIKWKEQIDDVVNAISDGVSDIVDGILDGGVDVKKAALKMFKSVFMAGIKKGLDQLEDWLIKGFEKMFKSVGGAVGSAILTVIGLIGMMLMSGGSKSWSASGVGTGVTTHEAVRGVIAGETSIPIGQISVSLQDALLTTNGILEQIEENTRSSGAIASIQGNLEVKLSGAEFLEGLKDALTQYLEEYFAQALMTGA